MIRAKKYLGQHFLKNESICKQIADSLPQGLCPSLLEIGPGMGALTKFLTGRKENFLAIEKDPEAIEYLISHKILTQNQIISGDFLSWDPDRQKLDSFGLIGNFPYNISSAIIFRMLELKHQIPCCVGMFQKEVGQRLASKHGNRIYGITSVLLQAFYEVEYLFELTKEHFSPPPKINSAVLRFQRKKEFPPCDEKIFFRLVKTAFGQRRKTLKNALKPLALRQEFYSLPILNKRAEALSVDDFLKLSELLKVYL